MSVKSHDSNEMLKQFVYKHRCISEIDKQKATYDKVAFCICSLQSAVARNKTSSNSISNFSLVRSVSINYRTLSRRTTRNCFLFSHSEN